MTDFRAVLRILAEAGVDFIVVGGVAAGVHGSARSTVDIDLVYRRGGDNQERLVSALADHNPYLRGAPPGLPFRWDTQTIERGLNFTLTTSLGDIDLLGEIVGGGKYEDLLPYCIQVEAFGVGCQCLGLKKLIQVKRAAGRPKDLEAIAELEALLEEKSED